MRTIPLIVGIICLIIGIVGGIGYSGDGDEAIGVPPCIEGNLIVAGSCNVGMADQDIPVPDSFGLINVKVDVEWSLSENTWVGVVDSSYAEDCPPEDNGLTDCTKEEFEYVAGGPDADGSFIWEMESGSYRFVTGSDPGTNPIDENQVTYTLDISMKISHVVILTLIGGAFIGFGIILNPKEEVMDAVPLNEVEREEQLSQN